MPNLLAHIGAQGILTRGILKRADAKWVLLGCLIPDLPWILQRIVRGIGLDADLYDLRLYAITQASFAGCLILCGALAALAAAPGRVFLILALNSFLHLLLDAMQTKWANGVHFVAPLSWRLVNFELFWPESLPSVLLTVLGLFTVVWLWRTRPEGAAARSSRGRRRLLIPASLFLAYGGLPLLFLHGPETADNHFVRTLREVERRPGREVEFDRNRCLVQGEDTVLQTFAGEQLLVAGNQTPAPGTVSLRARFRDRHTIEVLELHAHAALLRDAASVAGLAVVFAFWARAGWVRRSHPGNGRGPGEGGGP
jgi:hypothetical protein